MTGINFQIDVAPWLALLDDLIDIPFRVIGDLEDVLGRAFDQTQGQVHVVTGSLRASGRPESHYSGAVWEGNIDYGGPAGGYPHDPVNYAGIERGRGGDHDFLSGLDVYNAEFLNAMLGAWP